MSKTIEDYMPNTPDINQERLEVLKQECPDWFTKDGQLDIDEIKKTVNHESVVETERFDFTWFGKSQAKREAFEPTKTSLKYDKERSCKPEKGRGNIIVEGENLEVLKLLLSSYREQVKCIYIDPPYNTGRDRIYKDDFSTSSKEFLEFEEKVQDGVKLDTNLESSGRFHSNWMNLIYPRLLLSRQLLKEDGVIFISIDDHELHNLRKVMDQVYGEENFLGCISVVSNWKGRSDDKYFATAHNYLVVYKKRTFKTYGIPLPEDKLSDYPNIDEDGNRYRLLGLRKRGSSSRREDRPNMYYPVFVNPKNGEVSLEESKKHSLRVTPHLSDGTDGRWRWGTDRFKERNDELVAVKSDYTNKWRVFQIDYASGDDGLKRIIPKTVWTDKKFANEAGTLELKEIFGKKIFDNPKPSSLIKHIIKQSTDENDIILDFFAGSGSTGQAAIEINKENNISRNFILVQIPEKVDDRKEVGKNAINMGFNTISSITIARNKKIIEGYGDQPEPVDSGFKVYKLAKSNFPRVEFSPDASKSQEENVEALKKYIAEKESGMETIFNKQDIINEVLLKNGFMLDYKLTEQPEFEENDVLLAEDENREALVCLDKELSEKTVEHFKGNDELKFICLERALNTSKKWNLKHYLGDKLNAM